MKKTNRNPFRWWFVVVGLSTASAVALQFMTTSNGVGDDQTAQAMPEEELNFLAKNQVTSLIASPKDAASSVNKTETAGGPVQSTNPPSSNQVDPIPANRPGNEEQEANPYLDEGVKAQLMQVADLYEEASRYPANSQPIYNTADLSRYLPPSASGVELPFPANDGAEPVKLKLDVSKYQFFHGENIPVSLHISNASATASISGVVKLKDLQGNNIYEQPFESGRATGDLMLTIPASATSSDWPVEMQVVAFVDLDGKRMSLSAPIKFNAPSAVITSVSMSEVQAEYLRIPVQIKVNQSGYYFMAANLYSQKGKPLVHLEAEGKLDKGDAQLNLNAHIDALEKGGDEGPYLLKDLSIVRSAKENESTDVAGHSMMSAYLVEGYAFDTYQHTPYEDPMAKERLAFLRKMGQL